MYIHIYIHITFPHTTHMYRIIYNIYKIDLCIYMDVVLCVCNSVCSCISRGRLIATGLKQRIFQWRNIPQGKLKSGKGLAKTVSLTKLQSCSFEPSFQLNLIFGHCLWPAQLSFRKDPANSIQPESPNPCLIFQHSGLPSARIPSQFSNHHLGLDVSFQ